MLRNKRIVFFFVLALVLMVPCFAHYARADAEKKTIKVGYIDSLGFIFEENGKHIGYGAEYLEIVSDIAGWNCEYIYDTWENCLRKLETGELDIVCMASKLEEREDEFLFSNISLGSEFTVIHVAEEMDVYYEEYEKLDGCRVGLLKGSNHSEDFIKVAEDYGIEYETVYYGTETAVVEALEKGVVDVISIGSLYGYSGGKIVGKFNVRPYYCMTSKANKELMEELNEAMQHFQIEHRGIETELYEKYYGDTHIYNRPEYTREEQEYIENCGPIKVKLLMGSKPLSYIRDGIPDGIFPEYLRLLTEKSGLVFDIELDTTVEDIGDKTKGLNDDSYLLLRSSRVIDERSLEDELIVSMELLQTELVYVKLVENVSDDNTDNCIFAVTPEMTYLPEVLKTENPECQIKYYDSADKCLRAVIDGEADSAVQDKYIISYLLKKPEYADKLVQFPAEGLENGMCLIASEDEVMLFQILNKTINYIAPSERDNLIALELIDCTYDYGIGDMVYRHWKFMLCIVVIVIVSIIVYTILIGCYSKLKFKKKEYELLRIKVQQDELTGVYNRAYFYEKAEELIEASKENMCIVIADIVRFKVVNDLYGMETGDRLLRHIAQGLKCLTDGKDVVLARFTGDHFYMCIKERVFEEIVFPKRINTFLENMDIKLAYGVYKVNKSKNVPVNIMCDRANMAVHDKESNQVGHIRYYNDEERQKLVREQEIENDMEKAISERQFSVYVQPKYDIEKGTISGGEALVRWMHPQRGLIPPGDFINIFEKNGFILHLDYYVWEETCKVLEEIQKRGLPKQPVSINVSRAHFYGNELIDKLSHLVEKYNLKPEDLEIELTESLCVEDSEMIYSKIRKLQELGFTVSMDDFGSGYSSLNMLKEMPLDVIKMDLKFLDGGEDEEKSRNILKTLIKLAQRLQLDVVVEGVETKEQVDFLRKVGNCQVQGYYFSKPVPSKQYISMLINT